MAQEQQQQQPQIPDPEQVRAARHAGFLNSLRYEPEERRAAFAETYGRQDARREANITNFYQNLVGR